VQRKHPMDINLTAQRCGWYSSLYTYLDLSKTNAADAEIFLIFANLDPSKGYKGITCFIAEKEWGVEIAKKEKKVRPPPPKTSINYRSSASKHLQPVSFTSTISTSPKKTSLAKKAKATKSPSKLLMKAASVSPPK